MHPGTYTGTEAHLRLCGYTSFGAVADGWCEPMRRRLVLLFLLALTSSCSRVGFDAFAPEESPPPAPPTGGNNNTTSALGNGVIEDGEQCDDSNRADGDGCDSDGQIETGWVCVG